MSEYARYPSNTGGSSGVSSLNGQVGALTLVAGTGISIVPGSGTLTISNTEAGGTVTSFSFVNANGFTGTVTNPTTTPALTLTGTLSGDITGPLTSTAITATTNSTLHTLSALSLPYSQVTGGPGGTVTSVGLSAPGAIYSVSGSPVTTSGTLTLNLLTQTANTVFAGPTSGGAANPAFRLLVSADIPNNAANTSGTAANITATTNTTLTSLPNLAVTGSQVGGFTQGSVIFAGASGQLTQDNSKFYWDDTNFALGLNTIPLSSVMIDGVNTSGASKLVQMTGYGVGSSIGYRGRFARGTLGTPSAVQNGDTLNTISGRGYGTSQFAAASTGILNVVAGETFTNTSNATYLQFEVTPTGSVTAAEAMRLNSTGNLLIGTTTDSGTQKLQVNGNSNIGTVTAGVWNGSATSGTSFITSGTTYTTPATITTATVFDFTLIGGGAGGSSDNVASTHSNCGGGGAGCRLITTGLSPSTSYTIAIGAAGAGGTAGNVGGSGTATTLVIGATTYTAGGGSAAISPTLSGGNGGVATNGTININGQIGGGSYGVFTSSGAAGGNSPWGWGLGGQGQGASVAANGNPATGYGGGGGGASSNGSPTGGAGTPGCIFVRWDN